MPLMKRWFRQSPPREVPASTSSLTWLPEWIRHPFPGSRRAARQAAKVDWEQQQIQRLGEISTTPALVQSGRVLTLVAGPHGHALDIATFLKPWLRSVQAVGLRGTVLYAGPCDLSGVRDRFPAIELVPVSLGSRHLHLERHFAIRDHLRQSCDEYVIITDGRDVAFRRDPFDIVQQGHPRICLASEVEVLGQHKHTLRWMQAAYHRTCHLDRPVFNPGIIGGSRGRVLELLEELTREIDSLDCRTLCCDMGIFNKVVHDHMALNDIVTGEPLHSRMHGWEFDTTAAILHK